MPFHKNSNFLPATDKFVMRNLVKKYSLSLLFEREIRTVINNRLSKPRIRGDISTVKNTRRERADI